MLFFERAVNGMKQGKKEGAHFEKKLDACSQCATFSGKDASFEMAMFQKTCMFGRYIGCFM